MLDSGFPGFFKVAIKMRNFKTDASGYDGGGVAVVDSSAARKAGRPSLTLRATMRCSGYDGCDGAQIAGPSVDVVQ
jgi:hypothetical protein